ncbi:MAG: D-alanyl-D-alanine carboxypeptidase, partial [Lachnospiraceae bacterium]|nr:D-alanyl-D-alanine carboxypeptidase [Lachnospiraceae bacterium]
METKAEDIELYAQSAVLMDGDTGRILFGKNETEIRAMASTTKIMTCILVLENVDLMEKAEVSALAASQPKVHLGVKEQEAFYVKDLLYSLMLESHNDTAVILAEKTAGSV